MIESCFLLFSEFILSSPTRSVFLAKNTEKPFVPFFTREETAYKIAWSKVKKVYEKNSKGNWAK